VPQNNKHYSFKRIRDGMTVAEAVAMVEKGE
jgi:hypothetical protein